MCVGTNPIEFLLDPIDETSDENAIQSDDGIRWTENLWDASETELLTYCECFTM